MSRVFKVGSLFCGAGGFDLGFVHSGHKMVWALDNDSDCIKTYRKNIGKHTVLSDIVGFDFLTLKKVDVIIGGFPCQGFSMANKHRVVEDDRNLLYLQFVQSLRDLKPKYFLAENVRGILSLDKGEVIKKIVSDFSREGYNVEYRVYNASDFQVPQNRIRVFIWGIRKDLKESRNWPEVQENMRKVSIGEALSDIPEPGQIHNLKNHIGSQYKITNKNFVGCRKTDPNKPSPTIIARGNGKGGVNAIQHPKNHRRMTVREQAIIQTFPIDFEFVGSMSSCYRQVGNAVPVKLAEEFGNSFRRY